MRAKLTAISMRFFRHFCLKKLMDIAVSTSGGASFHCIHTLDAAHMLRCASSLQYLYIWVIAVQRPLSGRDFSRTAQFVWRHIWQSAKVVQKRRSFA